MIGSSIHLVLVDGNSSHLSLTGCSNRTHRSPHPTSNIQRSLPWFQTNQCSNSTLMRRLACRPILSWKKRREVEGCSPPPLVQISHQGIKFVNKVGNLFLSVNNRSFSTFQSIEFVIIIVYLILHFGAIYRTTSNLKGSRFG